MSVLEGKSRLLSLTPNPTSGQSGAQVKAYRGCSRLKPDQHAQGRRLANARHRAHRSADEYGPKALAWYKSAFADRSQFETVEEYLWMYGPWFQVLVAADEFNTAL